MCRFSVVIAVYNKEAYIQNTIQSVLDQTYKDFEIIIVNDGSTDDSEKIIQNFEDPQIKYFLQENKGAGAARNAAISKATAPYIALLDADDFWDPGYLEAIDHLIETYPSQKVFAVACKVQNRKKINAPVYSVENLIANEVRIVDFFASSSTNSILTSSSTVLHRSVFEEVGGYDPKIKTSEDTDLWIRVGLKYNVVFKNTPYATYRFSPTSLSNSAIDIDSTLNLISYKKYKKKHPSLKKFLDLNHYSLAILAKRAGNVKGFQKHFKEIDQNNLNDKQRFLLNASPFIVRNLMRLKGVLDRFGLQFSAFK